jgi:hypothetical protein
MGTLGMVVPPVPLSTVLLTPPTPLPLVLPPTPPEALPPDVPPTALDVLVAVVAWFEDAVELTVSPEAVVVATIPVPPLAVAASTAGEPPACEHAVVMP